MTSQPSARRKQLDTQYREQLAQIEADEAQARLLATPRSLVDAVKAIEDAVAAEKRAPHDYAAIVDALIMAVKSVIVALGDTSPKQSSSKVVS